MKASELITLLQDAIDKYGDLPLGTDDDSDIGCGPDWDVIPCYDDIESEKPTEFFLTDN